MLDEEPISRFRGKYKWLSNFGESPFKYQGIDYSTVEHAYQSFKTNDIERRKLIRNAPTPRDAARLGRAKKTIIRDDWEDIKGQVMFELVIQKFKQNGQLAQKLLETGDRYLLEGNYWHDNYFGICCCKKCHHAGQGKNILGNILMAVRSDLREDVLIDEFWNSDMVEEYEDELHCDPTSNIKLFLRWYRKKIGVKCISDIRFISSYNSNNDTLRCDCGCEGPFTMVSSGEGFINMKCPECGKIITGVSGDNECPS